MSTAIATTGSHKTNGSSASVYSNEAKHIDKIEILGKIKIKFMHPCLKMCVLLGKIDRIDLEIKWESIES